MLEVSCNGRARCDGKLYKLERHRQRTRITHHGKKYDVAKLVRRAIHGPTDWTTQFPRTSRFELWFEVSAMMLSDLEGRQ